LKTLALHQETSHLFEDADDYQIRSRIIPQIDNKKG